MKGFDTTPRPAFLLAMQNQKWTVGGALSELVDNSFGSSQASESTSGLRRGDAQKVVITYEAKKRVIEVLDNGRGMDEIGRLFQLGNTIGRVPGDIGMYGSGGTMALLWLAKHVSVWTLRDGRVSHDVVDWKKQIATGEFPIITSEWTKASKVNTPSNLLDCRRGTLIRLVLQDERNLSQANVSNVTRDLAITYSPALRMGRELVWKTIGRVGGERMLSDPLPELSNIKTFSGVLELRSGNHLPFFGKIGVVQDLPQSKSVISISYGTRVIKTTRDCFGSTYSDEKYNGIGVCGFLDLGEGWQPYLSTTKDDINDDEPWTALMQYVFEQIRPLLQQLQDEKLDMILDDLALELTSVFDGCGQIELKVANNDSHGYGSPHGLIENHGTHSRGVPKPSETPGEDVSSDRPAATQLVIWPCSDAELEGALCRFDQSGGQYMVLVNKDHRAVAEALQAKPTNRIALMFLINSEIAATAARDEKFCKLLFRPKVVNHIERTQGWPGSLICRFLMDRVRNEARA